MRPNPIHVTIDTGGYFTAQASMLVPPPEGPDTS